VIKFNVEVGPKRLELLHELVQSSQGSERFDSLVGLETRDYVSEFAIILKMVGLLDRGP
jgi:hypothetical protein